MDAPNAMRSFDPRRVGALECTTWVRVAEGCDRDSPRIAEERTALVRSYAALLAAVHR